MKLEQLEIERLRREVIKLKAERDILKKPGPTSRRTQYEVRRRREASRDLAGGMVVRGGCLAGRVLCVADAPAQCPLAQQKTIAARVRTFLPAGFRLGIRPRAHADVRPDRAVTMISNSVRTY
jgi:hypothetical protein